MRTLTTQELAALSAAGYSARMRARIADAGGVFRDLTALDLAGGRDFTRSIRVETNIDDDFAVASIALHRTRDRFNISPLVSTSKLNAGGTLLSQGRLLIVEAFLLPVGVSPTSSDWREIFRGLVGPVMESTDTVEVRAFDLGHQLADAGKHLEREKQYGSAGGVAVETVMQQLIDDAHGYAFVNSAYYVAKDRVRPTTSNGFWYEATNTGTVNTEPAWPTTIGATVVSGAVTFKCMGTIPVLYVPASPSWQIAPAYNQKRLPLWAALEALVTQIGWELRYRWDNSTSSWRLTFKEPQRTKTSPDFTWYSDTTTRSGAAQPSILDIPSIQTGVEDVRNVIEGTYSDPADLDQAGAPKRKTVVRRDATSIDAYGWRWMSVAEGAVSQINTQAEMERMLDALLSDMKDPYATKEVVHPLFYAAELGDLYRYAANGYTYSANQDLAVVGIVHEQGERGAAKTTLTCRGKPSAGFSRWRSYDSDTAALRPAPFVGPNQPTGLVVKQVVGGLAVSWALPTSGSTPAEYEVHVSTTSGFTASLITLACVVSSNRCELGDLEFGTPHYIKVIARDGAGNRSMESAQVSGTPAYVTPGSMQPYLNFGSLMTNGDFESLDDVGFPEEWSLVGYTASDVFVSSDSMSGANALVIGANNASGTKYVKAPLFIVRPGEKYAVSVYAKRPVNSGALRIHVQAYDGNAALLGDITLSVHYNTAANTYEKFVHSITVPSNTRYIGLKFDNTTDDDVYIDSVLAERTEIPQEGKRLVGAAYITKFENGWSNYVANSTGFWKDSLGVVHLEGWIQNPGGTIPSVVFTLPAGYRPDQNKIFSLYSWNGSAQVLSHVLIYTNGAVEIRGGSTTEIALDGVTFRGT